MMSLDSEMESQGDLSSLSSGSRNQRSLASSAEEQCQDPSAVKVPEPQSPSSCLGSHATAVMSGSPKPCQLEEAPEDQNAVEEVSAAGMLDPPQCPEGSSSLLSPRVNSSLNHFFEISSSEQWDYLFPSESESDTDSLDSDGVDARLAALLQFLALKYLREEPTTMLEMEAVVTGDYEEYFPVIFKEASQCMEMVFGIEVKKLRPSSPFYFLVPVLGLTYDGMRSNNKGYPRIIFMILILGIIQAHDDRVKEEVVWKVLAELGVYPGKEHVIYGEPREFLTEDLVQERYITCIEVPNSNPLQYELLWGPRALEETSKMDVVQFLIRLRATILRAFPIGEDLEDEDEEEKDKEEAEGALEER
ncbi:melanoma-associated antigen 4 [Octodon degus]|uniref:Melanoma-associated antigen 4 n=1 Tax=Octodon degus TaxID=10160 RepID=A0A6P3FEF7_OCTDE|nr:melanoma-associated antigen 4 [Octodon degus]